MCTVLSYLQTSDRLFFLQLFRYIVSLLEWKMFSFKAMVDMPKKQGIHFLKYHALYFKKEGKFKEGKCILFKNTTWTERCV